MYTSKNIIKNWRACLVLHLPHLPPRPHRHPSRELYLKEFVSKHAPFLNFELENKQIPTDSRSGSDWKMGGKMGLFYVRRWSGLSYNRNDKICENYRFYVCANKFCEDIHPDPVGYRTVLWNTCCEEMKMPVPLINFVLEYFCLLTLEAMQMAHENKKKVIIDSDSYWKCQHIWKDIVCPSWYKCNTGHTTEGYYSDCGLLHRQPEDEKSIVKIFESREFKEWKSDLLEELKITVHIFNENKILWETKELVLEEGGTMFEERVRKYYSELVKEEKLRIQGSKWVKVKSKSRRAKIKSVEPVELEDNWHVKYRRKHFTPYNYK